MTRPRIPVRVRDWVELNRRVAAESTDTLDWLEILTDVIGRMSAYGGLAIDSTSAPYVGGPTVITNWDTAYPGVAGADAFQVTINTTTGTLAPDISGVFLVSVSISGTGGTGALYTVDFYRAGARLIGFTIDQSNQSARWTLSFSFMSFLNIGDLLDLRITASSSTTIDNAVFSITKTGLVISDLPLIQKFVA